MQYRLDIEVDKNSEQYKWAMTDKNSHILLGHVGTHIDVYNGSNIPLSYKKVDGVVFDVRGKNIITLEDIDTTKIKEKTFVAFYTSRIEKIGYTNKEYFVNHEILDRKLVEYLISKKVAYIAIDAPGIDIGKNHELVDRLCESNGVYVIENVCNLKCLLKRNFYVIVEFEMLDFMTGVKCHLTANVNN